MIEKVHISRFKSIKELDLDCRRINVFIGEPNTGKSNILEAVGGVFSFAYYARFGYIARDFIRFEQTTNLFYDQDIGHPLKIDCNTISVGLAYTDGQFRGEYLEGNSRIAKWGGDYSDLRMDNVTESNQKPAFFKFYRFRNSGSYTRPESDFLLPPYGDNLLALLLANGDLRTVVSQPFASLGLTLGLRPHEGKIELVKRIEPAIVSFPYSLSSETLQRVTFYLAAILTNKDSILFFEEPEAHAFPFYAKHLAELIALDQRSNQYFISTHNPYFLEPIVEKTPTSELAVYIVYFQDYQTKVKRLREKDLSELGEIDIFANLDRYLKRR